MTQKAWGGVFGTESDQRMEKFTESVSYDQRLYAHDIQGSIAHAQMLCKVGLLTEEECKEIEKGLLKIKQEIESGSFEYRIADEDIHMHIEKALTDKLGDTGRKLHTARSRNDQVSTDMRLWVRDAIDHLNERLLDVQKAFVSRCDKDLDVIIPGYTHLQRAQPVIAPHYWLAYCEKYERDRTRLLDCRKRTDVCSLGAAALAGTTLPIDRHDSAERLGFSDVARNSLDVASDRDFMVEFAFCLSLIATHLSNWAEEWILWATTEYNFIKVPQQFCTGSSIMPQKINPDVLELIRGKTARVIGNLQTMFVLLKGLPLAYNRDLQEDKPPIFDSFDTVLAALELAAPIISGAELKKESIASRLEEGYLDATTLMEYLIKKGIPQRTAHHIVGELVREAIDKKIPLNQLDYARFQQADERIAEDIFDSLGVQNALNAFVSYGSTAPEQVSSQIKYWKEKLT